MGWNWYVKPESERIDLGDGEWIEVKKELTVGETKEILSRSTKYVTVDGSVVGVTDASVLDVELVLAYLVGWSARDEKGVSLPLSRATLLAQSRSNYQTISRAINKHNSERVKEKNVQSSGSEPDTTSESAGT